VTTFLLAHVALRLRLGAGLGRGRPIAVVLLLGLVPAATAVRAVVALAFVSTVCVLLIVYEVLRHRAERAWIRSH
jgi:hypothetical protein